MVQVGHVVVRSEVVVVVHCDDVDSSRGGFYQVQVTHACLVVVL